MKKKVKERRKKLLAILFFLIKLNILAIPLYIILYLNFSFVPLQDFLTYATSGVLRLLGYSTDLKVDIRCNAPAISVSNQLICISWDSSGWKSLYLLAALVIATPLSNLKGKGKFLSISLPILFLINFFRILTTILFSLSFGFEYFEIVHTFLWRECLIFVVIAFWYLWLRGKYNIGKKKI